MILLIISSINEWYNFDKKYIYKKDKKKLEKLILYTHSIPYYIKNLNHVDLSGLKLTAVKLAKTNLSDHANLFSANLTYANLTNVIAKNTFFKGDVL